MKDSVNTLDKKGGNIEGYLESFCRWQSQSNPENWNKLSNHPDHWDHGLLLTGLDLYDGTKSQNSVIGIIIESVRRRRVIKTVDCLFCRKRPNLLLGGKITQLLFKQGLRDWAFFGSYDESPSHYL